FVVYCVCGESGQERRESRYLGRCCLLQPAFQHARESRDHGPVQAMRASWLRRNQLGVVRSNSFRKPKAAKAAVHSQMMIAPVPKATRPIAAFVTASPNMNVPLK